MQDSSSSSSTRPAPSRFSADRDPNYLHKYKRACVECVCVCVCVQVCAAIASVFKFPPPPPPPATLPELIVCKSQIFEVNACKTLKLVNFLSCIRNSLPTFVVFRPACLPPPLLISASNLFVFCVCTTVRIRAARFLLPACLPAKHRQEQHCRLALALV